LQNLARINREMELTIICNISKSFLLYIFNLYIFFNLNVFYSASYSRSTQILERVLGPIKIIPCKNTKVFCDIILSFTSCNFISLCAGGRQNPIKLYDRG